ncbi:MAG: hypothetical protein HQK86_12145 [Nitrospinae bacterium]|nr:hypothetical protein [Nitrospinota bacterium]MBF0634224.1 hypothetical protein [Nitrospinota bacterium]
MSRKWFGRVVALIAVSLAGAGCSGKIPGNPEAVVERYVKAVQTNDFDTVYTLNVGTARELRFQAGKDSTVSKEELKQNMERHKAMYLAAVPTFIPGQRWAERHFFPASSNATVGKAFWLPPFGSDPVNADYEKDTTVIVPVEVVYSNKTEAPEYQELGKVKSARYDCTLKKFRQEGAVAVYSHDAQWYLAGCIVEKDSIKSF